MLALITETFSAECKLLQQLQCFVTTFHSTYSADGSEEDMSDDSCVSYSDQEDEENLAEYKVRCFIEVLAGAIKQRYCSLQFIADFYLLFNVMFFW